MKNYNSTCIIIYMFIFRSSLALAAVGSSSAFKLQMAAFGSGGAKTSGAGGGGVQLSSNVSENVSGLIEGGEKFKSRATLFIVANAIPTNTISSVVIASYDTGKPIQDITPTLKWTYSDKDGNAQHRFQIQVSKDSFATAAHDSGIVSSSNQYYTTALLSTLQPDVAYKWRVRTFDGYEYSGWVNADQGFRIGQEALAIGYLDVKVDALGASILHGVWQRDKDPYFSWDVSDTGVVTRGFSYSIDLEPDDIIDTLDKYLQLPPNALSDGKHTFFVKAQDSAGLWTSARSFEVWVDTSPPAYTDFTPKSGSLTNNDLVPITISVLDQHSGIDEKTIALKLNGVKVAHKYDVAVNKISYEPKIPWGEGYVLCTLDLSDNIGNIVTPLLWEFVVDTKAPSGKVVINNGAAVTGSVNVSLNLDVISMGKDASPVSEMILSNDELFNTEKWEPFKTTRAWTLPVINGLRKVYVKFRDMAGNVSSAASDSITLVINAPDTLITAGPSGVVETSSAYFAYKSSKPESLFRYRFDNDAWSEWSASGFVERAGLIDGNHYFQVASGKDLNGNGTIEEEETDPTPAGRIWTVSASGLIAPAQLPPEEPTKYWRTE